MPDPTVSRSGDWQIEDVLAILDGSGITITDPNLLTRTLHKHGLMHSTPVGYCTHVPPVPPLARSDEHTPRGRA